MRKLATGRLRSGANIFSLKGNCVIDRILFFYNTMSSGKFISPSYSKFLQFFHHFPNFQSTCDVLLAKIHSLSTSPSLTHSPLWKSVRSTTLFRQLQTSVIWNRRRNKTFNRLTRYLQYTKADGVVLGLLFARLRNK